MKDPFSISPVSRVFGFDRGKPIDRYYIERFLQQHRADIKGHVLEIGDDSYTKMFGKGVKSSDVLNLIPSPGVTIVGDLATGKNIPQNRFDCVIFTQVLHVIYEVKVALRNIIGTLKPGGILLLTTAGISQSCRSYFHGDYWRFTDESLKCLLQENVPENQFSIEVFGNVAVAKAFLDGLALHEIPSEILNISDPDYQVVLTAKVRR